jgi:hypothetical protein
MTHPNNGDNGVSEPAVNTPIPPDAEPKKEEPKKK